MVIRKISGWNLSPLASAALRYDPRCEDQICNSRRRIVNERRIPTLEVTVSPTPSLFEIGSEITIYRRISKWEESPDIAEFQLNNVLQIGLNIDNGEGFADVNLFDHLENTHQDRSPIYPPYDQLVPHPDVTSIQEFQREQRVQTVGMALASSIGFILVGASQKVDAQKTASGYSDFKLREEAIPALTELQELIMRLARIEPSELEC